MRKQLQRRTFLRGAGVAIALPTLEAMLEAKTSFGISANEPARPIKRFVCLSNNYGVYRKAFFPRPDQTVAGFELPDTLKPLERHRRDITLFSNLDHGATGGHQGVPALLSGIKPSQAAGYPEGNVSADQKIAEFVGAATRFPSLTLQVNEMNQISFTRTGVQVPGMNLVAAYRALFIEEGAAHKATAAERMKRSRSILDVVMDDAKSVQRNLGKQDKHKFDEYLNSVRSLEKKIVQQQPWLDKSKPKTDLAQPPQGKGTEADLHAMTELIALAIETDSTRAITLSSGFTNGDFGLSGSYHGFSHHGQREKEVAALKRIELNQITQMAYLIELLRSKTDPLNGGTLLDHTTVLFGCGMATGEHSNKNLPLILAGGGFDHGGHKVYSGEKDSRVPAANLLLSILLNHGLTIDRFGSSTGTLNGLKWS